MSDPRAAHHARSECETCENAQACQRLAAINHDLARGVLGREGAESSQPGPCAAPPAPETPPAPPPPGAGGADGVHSLSPGPVSENFSAADPDPVAGRASQLCRDAARGFYALSDAALRADEDQAAAAYGDAADQMARVGQEIAALRPEAAR